MTGVDIRTVSGIDVLTELRTEIEIWIGLSVDGNLN